jgi:hypothetical protein
LKAYLALAGLMFAALLTAVLAVHSYWYFAQACTNTPYWDQWLWIDEIRQFREGATKWTYLFAPYWGQRVISARLILLASDQFFRLSNVPLFLTSAAAQIAMPVMLALTARSIFPGSPRRFALCAIVFAHLLLSSLTMEAILPQSLNHEIGYALMVGAVLVFPRSRSWGVLLAVLCTASLASGLLVFPVLAAEAWISQPRSKTFFAVLGVGAATAALYAIGYTRPTGGMGVLGVLLHPVQAIGIAAMVLGGPVSIFSRPLGIGTGILGLVVGGVLAARYLRRDPPNAAARSFALLVCLMAAAAALLAVGRYTPEWLSAMQGQQVIPGRYLVITFLYWSALFALALDGGRLPALVVSAVVVAMTFGTWNWQWRVPREWAAYFQRYDAIASGFLLGISDQENMAVVFPEDSIRARVLDYMRRRKSGIFAEDRAGWIGKSGHCADRLNIPADAPILRGHIQSSTRDLMAVEKGRVVGLARTLPLEADPRSQASPFFGYALSNSECCRIPQPTPASGCGPAADCRIVVCPVQSFHP